MGALPERVGQPFAETAMTNARKWIGFAVYEVAIPVACSAAILLAAYLTATDGWDTRYW